MKTCTECKQEFPANVEYFYKSTSRGQTLKAKCKRCYLDIYKPYRQKNKEKINKRSKAWYILNSEKHHKAGQSWRKENKDKVNETRRAWRKGNPDKAQKRDSKNNNRRRALRKGNGFEPYTEEQMLSKYGTTCYLCNEEIDLQAPRLCGKPGWERSLWIEHVVAISNGGPDTLDNVRPSHGLCNLRKGTKEKYETKKA